MGVLVVILALPQAKRRDWDEDRVLAAAATETLLNALTLSTDKDVLVRIFMLYMCLYNLHSVKSMQNPMSALKTATRKVSLAFLLRSKHDLKNLQERVPAFCETDY